MTTAAKVRARGSARLKGFAILAVLGLSALVFLAWSQSWGSLTVTGDGGVDRTLDVPGATAAPALAALGLAGLASAAALAIAGPVIRVVLGALIVVLGASIVLSGIGPIVDPVAAGSPIVTTATGVAGVAAIRGIATADGSTAWPILAIVLGALLSVTGVVIAVSTRRWPVSGRKYQAARFADESGAVLTADDLLDLSDSRDTDTEANTTDVDTTDTGRGDVEESPDEAVVRRKTASVDNWDSLSRGQDPTA